MRLGPGGSACNPFPVCCLGVGKSPIVDQSLQRPFGRCDGTDDMMEEATFFGAKDRSMLIVVVAAGQPGWPYLILMLCYLCEIIGSCNSLNGRHEHGELRLRVCYLPG